MQTLYSLSSNVPGVGLFSCSFNDVQGKKPSFLQMEPYSHSETLISQPKIQVHTKFESLLLLL